MIAQFAPYVRLAWYSTLEPNTIIGERDIFDYELLYLKEGNVQITVENRQFDAEQGDIFIFRPHQRHLIRCMNNTPVIQPHVHFDLQYRDDYQDVYVPYVTDEQIPKEDWRLFREDILPALYPNIPPRIHPKNTKLFEEYLFDLIHEYENPSMFTQVRQQWLFLRLFDLYLSEVGYSLHTEGSSHIESIAARIKIYLENHCSESLKLDELTGIIHIDKSYLIRIFKQIYGITPLAYHQQIRIQRARSMLVNTNLSITQISENTGFSSIHDFDRVFRKIDGSSPSSYRNMRCSTQQD